MPRFQQVGPLASQFQPNSVPTIAEARSHQLIVLPPAMQNILCGKRKSRRRSGDFHSGMCGAPVHEWTALFDFCFWKLVTSATRPPRFFAKTKLGARPRPIMVKQRHLARACKRCGSHPSAGPAHGSGRRSRASSLYSRCPCRVRNSGADMTGRCAQPQAPPDR